MNEVGTLEYLLDVCEDAADGANRISELLTEDNDPDTAEIFREIATERREFARRLSLMLAKCRHPRSGGTGGTFRGKLFRWRLQIAKHAPVGYRDIDDRRALLRLARHGSELVLNAYVEAEARSLQSGVRTEVHRQAEAVRAANTRIRRLAARA